MCEKNTVDFAVRFNAQIQQKKNCSTPKNKQIDPSFDHATHVEPSCILGQSICCGFHFIQKEKKKYRKFAKRKLKLYKYQT